MPNVEMSKLLVKMSNVFFAILTGTGRFGKDVSAKKSSRRIGKFFMPKRLVLSWFCFWFSTNWLGPVLNTSL